MKHALVVVSSHYLSVDLPAVSEGYVVGVDEEEAKQEVLKLVKVAKAPSDALASLFEPEVVLPRWTCRVGVRQGCSALVKISFVFCAQDLVAP